MSGSFAVNNSVDLLIGAHAKNLALVPRADIKVAMRIVGQGKRESFFWD